MHTLIKSAEMLRSLYLFAVNQTTHDEFQQFVSHSGWELIRLSNDGKLTVEGITALGWESVTVLYEEFISLGMEPLF